MPIFNFKTLLKAIYFQPKDIFVEKTLEQGISKIYFFVYAVQTMRVSHIQFMWFT